jgi:hypothetical protein
LTGGLLVSVATLLYSSYNTVLELHYCSSSPIA